MARKKYDDLGKEDLIRLLEARDRRDATRFGLVWEANEIERDKALNQDFVALDLDRTLSCPADAPAWKNLIIEGDNFDALRYLRMTFAGRVKCIYIDPPYNTGNKDFVYNDHYVDKEDLWRHSKWCEFMFQRLTLAKDLLREDGSIFVSIGDDEVFQLGQLMQRVFGQQNFVANVIWEKAYAPKNTARHFSENHDFILVYARNGATWKPNLVARSEKQDKAYKNPDDDPRGLWRTDGMSARNYYSKGTYQVVCPSGRIVERPPTGRYWIYSEETFKEMDKDGRIWWGKDGNNAPAVKRFLTEVKQGVVPQTIWPYSEVGHTQEAKKEIVQIVDFADSGSVFSTPKPVRLMERVLQLATSDDDLVLDFFAGSGTFAHAVHNLNKNDGGRRRVILVSSTEATVDEPTKNICRDICARRVRRVVEGYGNMLGLGGDFAYLRCRRIAPGRLTEIEHAQVWTALQLTHMPTITEFEEALPFVSAAHDDQQLIYVPHFRAKDAKALAKAVGRLPACIVYTWQPDAVKSRLKEADNVQVEAVPESLARRFGMRI
ncbi:MAG: site-specific DNA-methyltransferase [Planctomycetia bacterium]|nr:site-specific DNA-methyltransferase [Planctomycetia bacterium]